MNITLAGSASALLLLLVGCASVPKSTGPQEPIVPLETLQEKGLAPIESPAAWQSPDVLLTGGTVMTANGQIHEGGYVHMSGGKVLAVGPGEPSDTSGAKVIDVTGFYITPGIIDVHSHLGVYPSPRAKAHSDGNEATAPVTAGVWAEHSFWPQDPGIERAVAGGVTTIQALPGSANLVGGRGVILHMVPQRGSRAMRFPGAPETVKMACGENPKRVYGNNHRAPSTRMGNVHGLRSAFLKAQAYDAKWKAYEGAGENGGEGAKRSPDRDLDMETLVGLMSGDILAQVHCYRADDMLSILQVADEFGFEIKTFHHALEAYKIRDVLAERGVASATWADWWGFKLEAYDGIPYNAAMLTEAGAPTVIHSDSAMDIQRLNQEAGKAYTRGLEVGIELSEDDALAWITRNAAAAIGIEDQVGTLEVGKVADVVVWTAHPFSVYSKAQYVFVDGALRYNAEEKGEPWSDFELGQGVVK